MATDPICGMFVEERSARFMAESGGKTYYFCSAGCMKTFNANPTKYAK